MTIPRISDEDFEAIIASDEPVLVTFSAPKSCPRCPVQVPALEEVQALGFDVFHVDVEQSDSAKSARARPFYLGTPKNKDGTKGEPRMMPDFRVPAHYVFQRGKPVARLTGLQDANDLVGLFRHGARVGALGVLGDILRL